MSHESPRKPADKAPAVPAVEDEVDEAILESFPASDPPSWTLGHEEHEEPPRPAAPPGPAPKPGRRKPAPRRAH